MNNCGQRPGRHGLAPLEFVIGLPLLLFLMALMVNFGVVSSWKVRGLVAARHQVWSSRHTRSTLRPPWITAWEQPSSSNAGGTADMTDLDLPELQHPVGRGKYFLRLPRRAGSPLHQTLQPHQLKLRVDRVLRRRCQQRARRLRRCGQAR